MIRRPPRSTLSSSSAASDVYKRQVVDRRGAKREPAGASFAATRDRRLLGGVGAHASLQVLSGGQAAGEEVAHAEPAGTGGCGAIAGPVHGQDGVPSAVVPMELMDLPQLGEPAAQLVDVGRRRMRFLVAEQPQQWAGQLGQQVVEL